METANDHAAPSISVSTMMPNWLRIGLGCVGAFICFIIAKELGPALWPLSLLTVFFGLIALAGLCIGLALVISCAFGPDMVWEFKPGQLQITQELRGLRSTQTFYPADIAAITIETETKDSGADAFVLTCTLIGGVMLEPLDNRVAAAGSAISILMSASQHFKDPTARRKRLNSPSFATLEAAQAARSMVIA